MTITFSGNRPDLVKLLGMARKIPGVQLSAASEPATQLLSRIDNDDPMLTKGRVAEILSTIGLDPTLEC